MTGAPKTMVGGVPHQSNLEGQFVGEISQRDLSNLEYRNHRQDETRPGTSSYVLTKPGAANDCRTVNCRDSQGFGHENTSHMP